MNTPALGEGKLSMLPESSVVTGGLTSRGWRRRDEARAIKGGEMGCKRPVTVGGLVIRSPTDGEMTCGGRRLVDKTLLSIADRRLDELKSGDGGRCDGRAVGNSNVGLR